MGRKVSHLNVGIGADSKKLRSELAKANSSLKGFQRSVKGIGVAVGLTFGAHAFGSVLRSAVTSIANFEAELQKVKAITGATGGNLDKLKANALELGRTTKFTATQVAGLQVEFGKLGFTSSEIVNATKSTLDLATATGSDLAGAAAIAGTTLRAFQLDSSEMGRVTDVMGKSFVSSALDLSKFAESMKFAAPVAKSAGVSIEFTTAMLSALVDAGISGSMAGTSLRRILNEMAKTGKPTAEAFREIASKGISLEGAMDEVGRTAQTALNVLSSSIPKVEKLADAYDRAEGSVAAMAETIEDNLLGDVTKLSSAWDGAIQKGSGIVYVLRNVVQLLSEMLGYHDEAGFKLRAFNRSIGDNQKSLEHYNKEISKYKGLINDQATWSYGGIDSVNEKIKHLKKNHELLTQVILEQRNAFVGPENKSSDFSVGEKLNNEVLKEQAKNQLELIRVKEAAAEKTKKYREEIAELNKGLKDYQENVNVIISREVNLSETLGTNQLLEELNQIDNEVNSIITSLGDGANEVAEEFQNSARSLAEMFYSAEDMENIPKFFQEILVKQREVEIMWSRLSDAQKQWVDFATSAAITGFGIVESVAKGAMTSATEAFRDFGMEALNVVQQVINAKIKQAIISAVAGEASKGLFGLVTAGVAVAGFKALLSKHSTVPKLAKGGIASGMTSAVVGEYPGANVNPEVIAPLDKLQKMIGGGGETIVVNFPNAVVGNTAEVGRKLTSIIEEYNRRS